MTSISLASPRFGPSKYVAVASQALRQRLQQRALLLGRNVFLVLVLLVFSRLWHVLLDGGSVVGTSASDYVWYMAVAEWITLSQPQLYLDIERDVRSGDVAYHLTRPISYLAFKLSGAFAEMLLSMGAMAITALVASYAFTGAWPAEPSGLLWVVPLGLCAGVLLLLWGALIGLSAFWLQDCSPLYWIWQKLLFVLGGLFVPLALYPAWLREIAEWSPFGALLSGPARLVLDEQGATPGSVALQLLGWMVVTTWLLWLVYRRALRAVELNGG